MASPSSSRKYDVFISHAGEDKATIAIPLRDILSKQNPSIIAFVDDKDIPRGGSATKEMTSAMENADVAVIVLSPEFVAKKWPMKELLFFLSKREKALAEGASIPVILPVFYRLTVAELYSEPRLDRKDADGKSLYRKTRFFERMDAGEREADVEIIQGALSALHDIQGVENKYYATNELSSAPSRSLLLDNVRDEILKAIAEHVRRTSLKEGKPSAAGTSDEFHRCFPDEALRDGVLDFVSVDAHGKPLTSEGRIKNRMLNSEGRLQNVVAIVGGGGVGKSTILKGLATDKDVQKQFCDGVHMLSLGMDATLRTLFEELCRVLSDSGAVNVEEKLRKKMKERIRSENVVEIVMREDDVMREGVQEAIRAAMSWFRSRSCAFLVDDAWTNKISGQVLQQVFKLGGTGQGSIVAFTTREREIASAAPQSSIFTVTSRDAHGSESRKILFYHADLLNENDALESASIEDLLEICSGLPVTLAVIGKGVKMTAVDMGGHDGDAAWSEYLNTFCEHREQLLREDVGEYGNLYITLGVSIGLLEGRKEDKVVFETPLSFGEMYRRLYVLQKRSKVPASMLRHLWELKSEKEAKVVAMRFVGVGLAESEYNKVASVWRLAIHDSLHDYAIAETKRHGDGVHAHEVLLDGYSRGLRSTEGRRTMWWSHYLEDDGYIHGNLCRHLEEAGRVSELEELLKMPFWFLRREIHHLEGGARRLMEHARLPKEPFWFLQREIHQLEMDYGKNVLFCDELTRRNLEYLKMI